MPLHTERCEACRPDSPMVPADREAVLLHDVPGWEIVEVKGMRRLKRTIDVEDWESAVALVNDISSLASEADHHPTILLQWGKVTVQWWTHAIGGLHRNDFIMAARVNRVLDAD